MSKEKRGKGTNIAQKEGGEKKEGKEPISSYVGGAFPFSTKVRLERKGESLTRRGKKERSLPGSSLCLGVKLSLREGESVACSAGRKKKGKERGAAFTSNHPEKETPASTSLARVAKSSEERTYEQIVQEQKRKKKDVIVPYAPRQKEATPAQFHSYDSRVVREEARVLVRTSDRKTENKNSLRLRESFLNTSAFKKKKKETPM